MKLSKKEKNIFLAALVIGIGGGFIANIAVTAMYRFLDNKSDIANTITFVTATFFLFFVLIYMFNKIETE